MIIDTKFNIGDEVWLPNMFNIPCEPIKLKIKSFLIESDNIYSYFLNIGWDNRALISLLHTTKQSCQLECDRLNGVTND